MKLVPLAIVCASVLAAACGPAPAPPPPFKPVATGKELMTGVVAPAAEVLWHSVGSVVTLEGVEDFYPRTEDEWLAIEHAMTAMMETGNLLMIGDRVKDEGEWMKLSADLVDAGKLALDAARSRNPDRLFEVGGEVYTACDNCHQRYWLEGADPDNMPYPPGPGEGEP